MTILRGVYAGVPKAAFVLGAFVMISLANSSVKADPLFFSNVQVFQNGNATQVDLYSNPGTLLIGPNLSFRVDITGTIPPGGSDTLRITYNEAGSAPIIQDYQIPVFGSVYPPITLFFSVMSPGAITHGVASSLTLDLINSSPDFVIPSGVNAGQLTNSHTYSFNVQSVPEPATLLAFGSGLVALAGRLRRRVHR